MRLALWLQALLLHLAPRDFRRRFGPELLAVAGRCLEDERRGAGTQAMLVRGLRQVLDVAGSVLRLRLQSRSLRTTLLLLPAALALAAAIGWVDTHADEVQPAAFLLLVFTALLCFLDARRALLWWLLLGLSIPGAHLVARSMGVPLPYTVAHFAETFLALLPAGAGMGLGWGLRRGLGRRGRAA